MYSREAHLHCMPMEAWRVVQCVGTRYMCSSKLPEAYYTAGAVH